MDVTQMPCAHCGIVNEIISRRSHGDYSPLCANCQRPVREARKIEFVGEQGGLILNELPGKGLGVYTREARSAGAIVDRCPAYLIGVEAPHRVNTVLTNMMLFPNSNTTSGQKAMHMAFPWGDDRCFLLGYGMLYNHASVLHSNLVYKPYIDPGTNRRFIDFYAKRDIEPYTELTHTYTTPDKLWFSHKGGS